MKIKCDNCDFNNEKDSRFCQECGNELDTTRKVHLSDSVPIVDEISDVLFTPKKKTHALRNLSIFIGMLLGIIGILFVIYLFDQQNTYSNNITATSPNSENSPTPAPTLEVVYYLRLEDLTMESSGYGAYDFKGTIKNDNSNYAESILVRIDFYKDQKTTDKFDTRYITIPFVAGDGAYTFNQTVYVNYTNQFWFLAKVESAE